VDELRRDIAIRYLRETDLTVEDIPPVPARVSTVSIVCGGGGRFCLSWNEND